MSDVTSPTDAALSLAYIAAEPCPGPCEPSPAPLPCAHGYALRYVRRIHCHVALLARSLLARLLLTTVAAHGQAFFPKWLHAQ